MKRMSILLIPVLVLSLLIGAIGCGGDEATPTPTPKPTETVWETPEITAKLSHSFAADSYLDERIQLFADEVLERTKGRVQIDIYPAATLYGYAAGAEAVMSGATDLLYDDSYWWGGIVYTTLIDQLPGFFEGYEHQLRWVKDPAVKQIFSDLFEGHGVKFIEQWPAASWVFYMTDDTEVTTARDMADLRIYGPWGPVATFPEWAGLEPVSMPWEETTTAFETGMLDVWV
ncbi:TRAP transporter substrate-binding protein, partial [Chloroflexota bacterium]